MTNLRKVLLVAILASTVFVSKGQVLNPPGGPLKAVTERRVVPYPHIREADVMWLKRVWRTIDLRQKQNHPLYFPTTEIRDRQSLFAVLIDAILKEGSLTAYDVGPIGTDDEFTTILPPEKVAGLLTTYDTIWVEQLYDGDMIPQVVATVTSSADIKWYDIKEEWFFDRQRSVMDVRIIGICPMREKKNDMGEVIGPQPLFWIYFPEARYVLANAEVFNTQNDGERRSFDDIFMKRMFASYITKESNVYDRSIIEYKQGIDALLEAEKLKDNIFIKEHDLWDY